MKVSPMDDAHELRRLLRRKTMEAEILREAAIRPEFWRVTQPTNDTYYRRSRAPAKATAGVAFRLPQRENLVRFALDQEASRQGWAVWWEAHTNLLRRLLEAQPVPEYKGHKLHLTILALAEDMVKYYKGEYEWFPDYWQIGTGNISRVLSDFGPEGCRFRFHPQDANIYGWFPNSPNESMRSIRVFNTPEYQNELRRYRNQIEALAKQEAVLPPVVEGAPALPSPEASTDDTPENIKNLKRALVPLADNYHNRPIVQLPQNVMDILAEIAVAHGSVVAPAFASWREACEIARDARDVRDIGEDIEEEVKYSL